MQVPELIAIGQLAKNVKELAEVVEELVRDDPTSRLSQLRIDSGAVVSRIRRDAEQLEGELANELREG